MIHHILIIILGVSILILLLFLFYSFYDIWKYDRENVELRRTLTPMPNHDGFQQHLALHSGMIQQAANISAQDLMQQQLGQVNYINYGIQGTSGSSAQLGYNTPILTNQGLQQSYIINNTPYSLQYASIHFEPMVQLSLDDCIKTMEEALWSSRKSPITKKDIR